MVDIELKEAFLSLFCFDLYFVSEIELKLEKHIPIAAHLHISLNSNCVSILFIFFCQF